MAGEMAKKIVFYDSGRHAHGPFCKLVLRFFGTRSHITLSSRCVLLYLAPRTDTAKGGRSCPYAQRTWLTLLELGLPFETRKVDLSNKSKEFVDLYHEVYPDSAGMLT